MTRISKHPLFCLVTWCVIGASCLWYGFHGSSADHTVTTSLTEASQQSALATLPIRDIRVGQRVVARLPAHLRENAVGSDQPLRDRQEIDPAKWQKITLVMVKENGSRSDIVLLRPVKWINQHGATTGGSIKLSLPEQGLDGAAKVMAVEPCPPIEQGPGQVVTGTFAHIRGAILDIHISGIYKPLGVTNNHPIFSVDRNDFVPAVELKPGERLRILSGTTSVDVITRRNTVEQVYNLEVHGEYVFRVTEKGLLVHNTSPFEARRVGFGLSDRIDDFTDEVGAINYWDIYDPAEDIIGGNQMVEERLLGMMDEADEIHFNLTGMGNNGEFSTFDDILQAGLAGPEPGNVTNWEVLQIYEEFNGKTTWWLDGQDVTDMLADITL